MNPRNQNDKRRKRRDLDEDDLGSPNSGDDRIRPES